MQRFCSYEGDVVVMLCIVDANGDDIIWNRDCIGSSAGSDVVYCTHCTYP